MPRTLSDSISLIRKSSSKLNKITDDAAEAVRGVEEFLNRECSLGVSVYVRVTTTSVGDGHSIEKGLLYSRIGNRYRIGIYEEPSYDPEEIICKPWSDCSREDKLETIDALPKLIHELADKVIEKIKNSKEASETVTNLLYSLRQGK